MSAEVSFFDLGLVLGTLAAIFFCGWAFERTLRAEFRARPFEDHELREWLLHAQAKKRANSSREVRL
jgi:hypothetical protein